MGYFARVGSEWDGSVHKGVGYCPRGAMSGLQAGNPNPPNYAMCAHAIYTRQEGEKADWDSFVTVQ